MVSKFFAAQLYSIRLEAIIRLLHVLVSAARSQESYPLAAVVFNIIARQKSKKLTRSMRPHPFQMSSSNWLWHHFLIQLEALAF
jgi:hypothetical protein